MNRRGRHLGFAVVVLASLVQCTRALALTELVPGLPYLRPTAQMEALRLPNETAAVVIDLRQVAPAEVDAANALLSAIKPSGAASHRLILALVAPDTASALRTRLTQLPHCLTVGCTAIDFKTDLPVNTSAEADQLARAALAAGASPKKLLVTPPEKIRFDEGELMREHRGTATMKGPKTAEAPTSDKLPPPGPAAVTDAVMQRAVHIYLGLVALKRI